MKVFLLLPLLVLSGASYAGQSSSAVAPQPISVVGHVVDTQGQPIEGAVMTVRLGGSILEAKFASNPEGKWSEIAFPELREEGAYVISCELPRGVDGRSCDVQGAVFLTNGSLHCVIDKEISRPGLAFIFSDGTASVSNWDREGPYAVGHPSEPSEDCEVGTNRAVRFQGYREWSRSSFQASDEGTAAWGGCFHPSVPGESCVAIGSNGTD